jgi:hypothetical protein
VLDLDRLRQGGFTARCLGLVERYGIDDEDAMLAYAGPDRAPLEPRWSARPALEDVADPAVIRWVGAGKPWGPLVTVEQVTWQVYADRLAARAGAPPGSA